MILFADNFNFSENNFSALFNFLQKNGIKYHFDDFNNDLKKSWGNYNIESLNIGIFNDSNIYKEDFDFDHIAKDEFLSSFIIKSDLLSSDIYQDDDVFNSLKDKYPSDFELCKLAAVFWVLYWVNFLKDKKIDAVIVFGGNLIYSNALIKVAEFLSLECFVVEHFYTGNDFYFENRYSAIPNNSLIRSKRFFSNLANNDLSFLSKINNQKNKNVKQPSYRSMAVENYVLLLCQVPNDFSIFSPCNKWKNTLFFYKNIIKDIIQNSDKNVVVKIHPYERVKNNKCSKNTYDEIDAFVDSLSNTDAKRVSLVEEFSLEGLIQGCDFAITLNSQAGLDVIRLGKQLVCFGEPFYGRHGFTTDLTDFSELIPILKTGHYFELNFERYNKFMSAVFDHLIGLNEVRKIERAFEHLSLEKNKRNVSVKHAKNKDSQISVKSESTGKRIVPPIKNNLTNSNDRRKRLIRKFKNDPKRFFEDSKNPLLRFVGKVL